MQSTSGWYLLRFVISFPPTNETTVSFVVLPVKTFLLGGMPAVGIITDYGAVFRRWGTNVSRTLSFSHSLSLFSMLIYNGSS